jgi:hypothetical protein
MGDNNRHERIRRTPIGTRNKLTVQGLKDTESFVYRWAVDRPGRIDELYEKGYDIVDKEGKTVGDGSFEAASSVGSAMTKGVGNGETAYLMKIPRDIWNEQRRVRVDIPTDETEESIKADAKVQGRYGQVTVNDKK